ncbi:polysaccharide biosynthesis protein [Vagococcus sp. BWB3-3]|uniref:Polysaccharide biosynthesis protein n=1 Tax=Vagococcus allomyrinae TaxID=2794353 RepID=A0A940SU93_9ENTE|nr:polysaccharide biosynthesis protein [Vagococcus allomyrinae]MBP1044052.1 polysaccharide biosynthesis protein [Vagococcus allomyrinae]
MAKASQQRLMRGALLLTVTSFMVKILSAVYRVPFQNMVGDEGFYAYQQVYPIYGIAMTLSLSGLPVFLSKLVAEQEEEQQKLSVVRQIFPLVFGLSAIMFGVTFFGGDLLASWMGDKALAPLIKMVSFVFLLTPFLTSYRGYFQGELMMAPTAYSQLLEQFLRVGVILGAAFILTKIGWSIYQVGTMAMAGALVGGLGALIILWQYRPDKGLLGKGRIHLEQGKESRSYFRRFLVEGGLICGYSSLLVLFQLVDSFVIKNQLVMSGLTNMEAKITKGIYDRGQPLVQVGLVIAVALTTSFLPTLTKYHMEKKQVFYERTASTFLRVTIVIASGASVGLMLLLPYVNSSLFGDDRETLSLSLLMGTIFLMSLILAFQTLFQSRNYYRPALYGLVLGCVVKVLVSPVLTSYLGTVGASLATLLGLGACLFVLVYNALQMSKYGINSQFIWKLMICLGMMVVTLVVYRWGVDSWLVANESRPLFMAGALVGVALGGSVFLWLLISSRLFTLREWLMIPMGKKLLRLKK